MKILQTILLFMIAIFMTSCYQDDYYYDESKINIVTTTAIIGDLVRNIGQDRVIVTELMGSGIDPHTYNATAGDIRKIQKADLVALNGLDLEGKMEKVFVNLEKVGITHLIIGESIHPAFLKYTADKVIDPHIWFDVNIWIEAAKVVCVKLSTMEPENQEYFQQNKSNYIDELLLLDSYIKERANELKKEQRVLITAHDAFNYFGNAYDFKVIGLQGISSLNEAGIKKISEIADYIKENKIKAVFIENSVPKKTIEALQMAVKARGFKVDIGGELYSDSLGKKGTPEGTYIGAFKANIDTIIEGLR